MGDGANDLGMLGLAGSVVALHAKPTVAAQAKMRIDHGDLTALLYIQGYRKTDFVVPNELDRASHHSGDQAATPAQLDRQRSRPVSGDQRRSKVMEFFPFRRSHEEADELLTRVNSLIADQMLASSPWS